MVDVTKNTKMYTMLRICVSTLILLLSAAVSAQERQPCENDLLTKADVEVSAGVPSSGIKLPHARSAAADKAELKAAVRREIMKRPPREPGRPDKRPQKTPPNAPKADKIGAIPERQPGTMIRPRDVDGADAETQAEDAQ